MPESILQARSPLDGVEIDTGRYTLRERTQLALISMACGDDDRAELVGAVQTQLKLELPDIGRSTLSSNGDYRLLGLQPGLWFLMFEHPGGDPLLALNDRSNGALSSGVRRTDQSDAWVFLELTGPDCTSVLERLCSVDTHPDHFRVGHLARTVMEHTGVILVRTDHERWLMLSARSSAGSFLHTVRTAVESGT